MWILPLLLFAFADAKSAGITTAADRYGCDWDVSPQMWGCQTRNWNASRDFPFARGYCQDSNFNSGKFMWWTAAPGPAPAGTFTMRTGDGSQSLDVRTYTPGGYVSVYIRALEFDKLYRGLLLYAKNSNGSKVGDWIVPEEASPQFSAADPVLQLCNQSVMHVNAEDKPYKTKFTFVAPPAGTGPVTIQAMIKTGPPNPTDWGNFYRLTDIVLQEAEPKNESRKWVLLPEGQSCKTYCEERELDPCSDSALSSSMAGIQPNPLDTIYACHGAVFQDCEGNPGVRNPGSFCTYHPSTCGSGASCSRVADASSPLFCVCGTPILGISGSSQLAPGLSALLALLFAGMWGSKSHMAWGTLALLLFTAMPMANAHNWMEGTRGRASNLGANQFCSPTFPQISRNTIHLQVAAGQEFVVEWAAAHGDYTYWIMIADEARGNVSKLTRKYMDDYLKSCPSGGFANSTATGMKYHRFRPNQNLASTNPVNSQSATSLTYANLFKSTPITNGTIWNKFNVDGDRPLTFYIPNITALRATTGPAMDVIWPFNFSAVPRTMLAEYNPAYMINDRRCSYKNSTNPWIIGIHRYQHHDVLLAYATAVMSFPANTPPGRYQLHYKWSSYCDVIDVDVRAAGSPVAAPYGTPKPATETEYDVAHHCWFENPRRMGQCFEVVTSPQQCAAMCSFDSACKAFQMLPLQMDSKAGNSYGLFPDKTYIPWNKNISFCDKAKFANAQPGSMICYPVYTFQDDFGSARPLWSFTDDPDHQGFYGTCYLKPRSLNFLPTPALADDTPNTYRYQSKCLPCDNLGQDLKNPRWGPQQNYCTDCSKVAPNPRKGPVIQNWTWVNNFTFADPVRWLSPAGTPYAFEDECRLLAQRDSQCSKYVMYSDLRARRFSGRVLGIPPTNTTNNFNSTYRFINTTQNWHFNDNVWNFGYYRTCGCLPKPTNPNATMTTPTYDVTGVANACEGVRTNQCTLKGFNVYQLP